MYNVVALAEKYDLCELKYFEANLMVLWKLSTTNERDIVLATCDHILTCQVHNPCLIQVNRVPNDCIQINNITGYLIRSTLQNDYDFCMRNFRWYHNMSRSTLCNQIPMHINKFRYLDTLFTRYEFHLINY